MDKIKIDNNGRLYPMPMTVVGAMVRGQPNYLAVAWVCRVNAAPPTDWESPWVKATTRTRESVNTRNSV